MPLRIRRGVEADRTGFTPLEGEPIYVTDSKKVYIGDGSTAGGVNISQALTVDTQDFTASGTWTKPANALWVEVTMCGAGEAGAAGSTGSAGQGGNAGKFASKTFLASDLASTVSVTCGSAMAFATYSASATSSFGTHVYAPGASSGGFGATIAEASANEISTTEAGTGGNQYAFSQGGAVDGEGRVGPAFGPGGGGGGGGTAAGYAGGKASSGEAGGNYYEAKLGGGGAGGASGTTGVAGTAGGYDTVTGFGHGGGGGGRGTAGSGGAGGAAVRGGGGGGGGIGTTAGGAGGAGGNGFVRVRTLCFG